MTRFRSLLAGIVGIFVVAGSGVFIALGVFSATSAVNTLQAGAASGGGGGGGGGGSCCSGGGGAGGGGAPRNCGGGNNFLATFEKSAWGPGWPTGAAVAPFMWPTYQGPNYDKMVLPVDPSNGYVWGPSNLPSGYNPNLGSPPGEGFPPGATGPFTTGPFTTYPGYINIPGSNPFHNWNVNHRWECFVGSPGPPPSAPQAGSFNLSVPTGTTATQSPNGMLVMDSITAQQGSACPLGAIMGPAGIVQGIQAPAAGPPSVAGTLVKRSNPGCPDSAVWTANTNPAYWSVTIWEQPIPNLALTGCTTGSGSYKWDWQPAIYTGRDNHCSNAQTDITSFFHVWPLPGVPVARTAPTAGVSVQLTVGWQWLCTAVATRPGASYSFNFYGGAGPGLAVQNQGGASGYTVGCDPQFIQSYTSTNQQAVMQIETMPLGQ